MRLIVFKENHNSAKYMKFAAWFDVTDRTAKWDKGIYFNEDYEKLADEKKGRRWHYFTGDDNEVKLFNDLCKRLDITID